MNPNIDEKVERVVKAFVYMEAPTNFIPLGRWEQQNIKDVNEIQHSPHYPQGSHFHQYTKNVRDTFDTIIKVVTKRII